MNREALEADLVEQRIAGWIGTLTHDVRRKAHMLASGERSVSLGVGELLPTTVEEVLEGLGRLADWDFARENGSKGRSWVSAERVADQVEAVAERLRLACERRERVFFGTGHPTGPLEMYARLTTAMREGGATVLRVAEGESFDGYVGGSQIRYICDVACVSMGGDLGHTHSSRPMEYLLSGGLRPDLVVGDHGFAGAGLMHGADAVAMVDTNDPGLILAWVRGLPILPILCDDNRPPGAYEVMTRFILDRL